MGVAPIIIGNVNIKNNVFLAPMAGIADLSFRILCKEQGAGMVYTEMISAKGLFYDDKKTRVLLETTEKERPITVQLFGREPDIISKAIGKLDLSNIDLLDLNFGCPAPKIVKNGEGSALMKEPKLIGEITKATVKASPIPVTVKIRRGWDEESENAVLIAKIAEDNGAAAITVHGRFSKQMYTGTVDWGIIQKVKENVKIPVIGNGDIDSYAGMEKMFKETSCDAVMVGRAAKGNPWIFHELLNQGAKKVVTNKILNDLILYHIKILADHKGEYVAVREMRKHISWYLKGLKNSIHIKNLIVNCDKIDDMIEIINNFLQEG